MEPLLSPLAASLERETMAPPRCLIVDDLDENLVAMQALLKDEPAELVLAHSGSEALDLLLDNEFALALIDVRMPEMDGFELAELMRSAQRTRAIPIIFVTAGTEEPGRVFRGYEAGAVDFLVKPLDPLIVRSKVRVFLELYQHRQLLARQFEESKRQRERGDFLSSATVELASILDPEQIVAKLSSLLVPAVGDACAVFIRDEEGTDWRLSGVSQETSHGDFSRLEAFLPVENDDFSSRYFTAADEVARAGEGVGLVFARRLRKRGMPEAVLVLEAEHRDAVDTHLLEELSYRAGLLFENACLYHAANRALAIRDHFLSLASHELKTPLTTLKLHTEAILFRMQKKQEQIPSERVERMLATTLGQVDRLNALVDDMLDVARIEGGRLSMTVETFDMRDLVSEVVERMQPLAEKSGANIVAHLGEPANGRWDRQRIDQVVTNLVSNAIRYGLGKPIDVGMEATPTGVSIRVADRGKGIAPEDRERIFERFERASSRTYSAGLGLGLYIVRHIVSMHGGTIGVESEADRGSTFVVDLPLQPPIPEPDA